MMNSSDVIKHAEDYVRKVFASDSSGHDWWHAYRVRNLALYIAKEEKADLYIVELAALLHDISDVKFNADEASGLKKVSYFLMQERIPDKITAAVLYVIKNVSFKGAGVQTKPESIEAMVVQDADRIDAIGAIGIARVFAFGGHFKEEMYNPDVKPRMHSSFEEYDKRQGHTINHFYEKLLLLKDRMNTKTAKELAEHRHNFMKEYLKEFFDEWEGKA